MHCTKARWGGLLPVVVLAAGCPNKNPGEETGFIPDCPTWYIDYDGDGYGSTNLIFIECDQPDGFVANSEDCDDLDAELHPETTWHPDADGDTYGDPDQREVGCTQPAGYVLDDQDCDDSDPMTNPETLYFRDTDGDGYGYPGFYVASCERPEGYTANARDCDDSRDDIHPDADELCDERDNDCDNTIDEDPVDAAAWYEDADGDGYGDPATGLRSCDPVSGRVDDGTDCDDAAPAIYPGALEICNDGLDNDCDGAFDRCWAELDAAHAVIEGDEDGAAFGRALAPAGDVNGDGAEDLWVGAYLDDAGGDDAGAVFLLLGPFGGTEALPAAQDAVLTGGTSSAVGGDNLGFGLSGGVDADGDGTPDVLIGAHRNSDEKSGMGMASLVFGQPSGTLALPGDGDVTFLGEGAWARMGYGVLLSPDMGGDGRVDVVVGAPYYPNGVATGGYYVFDGPFTPGSEVEAADARLIVYGEADNDVLGYTPRSLDYDGDGRMDLLFGGPQIDGVGSSSGGAYVVQGQSSGVLTLSDADWAFPGLSAEDQAGSRVRPLGDLDGDGLEDFGLTAPGEDTVGVNAGAVYVVYGGTPAGTSLASAPLLFTGALSEDAAGSDLGSGDLDGDGLLDLVIGASYAGSAGEGETYLFYAPPAGTYSLADADVTISGEAPADNSGGQLLLLPDLLGVGDGRDDLVSGVWLSDRGANDAGSVFVFGEFVE